MPDVVLGMVKKRIEEAEAEALRIVIEKRRALRDARLARARLSLRDRAVFVWSRWTGRVTKIV